MCEDRGGGRQTWRCGLPSVDASVDEQGKARRRAWTLRAGAATGADTIAEVSRACNRQREKVKVDGMVGKGDR